MEVVANTLGAVSEFEANTLPRICKVAPSDVLVPIPTKPEVPNMDVVLSVGVFIEVVANTLGAVSAFEANTLPWT